MLSKPCQPGRASAPLSPGKKQALRSWSRRALAAGFAAALATGCLPELPEYHAEETLLLHVHHLISTRTASIPPNLLSGLELWYRAGDLTASHNAAISSWPDSSGNGRTATNGVGGEQPLYQSNVLNGQPVLLFDGSDDSLQSTDVEFDQFTIVAVTQVTRSFTGSDYRMPILSKHDNNPNFNTALYYNWNGSNGNLALLMRNSINGTSEKVMGGQISLNTWYVNTAQYDGSVRRIYQDGVLFRENTQLSGTLHNNGSAFHMGRNANGLTHRFGGCMAEVMMFSRSISDEERAGLECYLGTRYALSVGRECL